MQIFWAAQTDPGLCRSKNEDYFCANHDLGLFVVADGMGGHAGGEVASEVAVTEIQNVIESTISLGSHDIWPVPFDTTVGMDGNRLRAGFLMANSRIAQQIKKTEELMGMGTTAVAVLFSNGKSALAHVGDSRAYLLRAGQLTRLTSDHSWVEEQLRAGMLTEAAAREHPWRNIVTRVLSGTDSLNVDVIEFQLEAGDRVLLCSDGLPIVVQDSEIETVVSATTDLQAVCDELVSRANAAGGPDNVTALVVAVATE
jgi:protein phosphatase